MNLRIKKRIIVFAPLVVYAVLVPVLLGRHMSEQAALGANSAKTYIVDDGVYYFAAGTNSHDAINNILAAKAEAGVAVDTAKMTAPGDAALVGSYTQEAFDAETYSVGANGEKITNQFDNVNMNYYYDGITYVSR